MRHIILCLALVASARAATVDRAVGPPLAAALGPHHEILLLARLDDGRSLSLFRADSLATGWGRLMDISFETGGACALAATPRAAIIALAPEGARSIAFAPVPLRPETPETGPTVRPLREPEASQIDLPAPVAALRLDACPWLPDSLACAHLAYLLAPGDTSGTRLFYRRSPDDGIHWSEPETIGQDSVALPALFARSRRPDVVDLVFASGDFAHWRAGLRYGARWEPAEPVRLRLTGAFVTRVAREAQWVFLLAETATHQIAGVASPNSGVNWLPAITIARASDAPRSPALDWGGGRFWAAFAQGDSLLLARWSTSPSRPEGWSAPIEVARGRGLGVPLVVALPDSAAFVLYGAPGGAISATRVR